MQDVRAIVVGGPQGITVADVYGTAWAYLVPIGFCAAHARLRALALPARVAVVRGARLMAPRDRGRRRLEGVPAPASAADVDQGVLPASAAARSSTSATRRCEDVSFAVERGRVLRGRRPERQRQEHAAQDPRRHLPRRRGHGARERAALALHRARRRLQPRAQRPRQHPHQRHAARADVEGARRSGSTRSSSFAELERFVDQKLKNYSSGMQVRLAFSIAIQVPFDVLLLDEVLAVGDEAFQEKCFATFDTIKEEGKTVVFVTHDLRASRGSATARSSCATGASRPPGRLRTSSSSTTRPSRPS